MSSLHGAGSRSRDGTVVERVLAAVAEREGTDPLDLPPLAETVDPDALERVAAGAGVREIAFTYHGRRIVVGDGRVRVSE